MKNTKISTKDLEKLVGLTEGRLRQIAATGAIPQPTDGAWTYPETVQRLFQHYRRRNELKPLDNAKLQKLQAEADLADIQLQRARKVLLPSEDVYKHMERVLFAIRAGILASNLIQAEKRDLLLELQRLLLKVHTEETEPEADPK